MAEGGEKSAIPFKQNASIPVRGDAAKGAGRRRHGRGVLPAQQSHNAFAPLDKVRKLRHGIPVMKGMQSP